MAEIHKLYRCHDRLLEHKSAVFEHLIGGWRDLFNVSFDVLLDDLTSTYFESDPPFPQGDKRRHGYSRDHRSDCVQVIIALVVTPERLPLAYEVLPGNTADNTTLRGFLDRIERQYGKARRIWLMDRGVPTETVLAEMRRRSPVQYLVGTPKGRLSRLEKALVAKPWQDARPGLQVKLLPQDGELYVFAQSADRVAKERAIRRRQLKWLWGPLKQFAGMKLTCEELLMRLGAARKQARTACRLLAIEVAADSAALSYRLDRAKLRRARRREGRYLLRTNLTDDGSMKPSSCFFTFESESSVIASITTSGGLSDGVVPPTGIDQAMKLGCNHPIGPLALADMIRRGCGLCTSSSSATKRDSETSRATSPSGRSFTRTRRAPVSHGDRSRRVRRLEIPALSAPQGDGRCGLPRLQDSPRRLPISTQCVRTALTTTHRR
jgi:hypothetical protein